MHVNGSAMARCAAAVAGLAQRRTPQLHQVMQLRNTSSMSSSALQHALRLQSDMATASPVTRVRFRGQCVHVKRDDVFHLAGNKMRKLHWFVAQDDAFYKDAHLFSFGGAQSNAMLAIAQLAQAKRVPFTYFSRGLQFRDTNPAANTTSDELAMEKSALQQGNLALAQELGMQHIELSPELYQALAQTKNFPTVSHILPDKLLDNCSRAVYIPQGAAFEQAQQGLALLAQEINAYIASERLTDPAKRFSVVVPCGTGTTALYMAQHLNRASATLFAVPCVGDAAYLEEQFAELVTKDASLHALQRSANLQLPRIMKPRQKSRFGRIWWPLYDIHHELLDATGIAFDLIYGSFAWHTMFDDATLALLLGEDELKCHQDEKCIKRELLYVHTGGVSGNVTMLARYQIKRKSQ